MDTARAVRLEDPFGEIERRLDPGDSRRWAIAHLDDMFRAGKAPDPLPDGFHGGRLLMMSVSRPSDAFVRRVTGLWMPWLGKSFDASANEGINVLSSSARVPMKALWPSYEPVAQLEDRLEVFPFRTRIAPGALDPNLDVLKIDYDFEANPGFIIRKILDELVQIDEGQYLGKILYRLRDRFRLIGFFSLHA